MKTIKNLMLVFVCAIAHVTVAQPADPMVLLVTKMHWKNEMNASMREDYMKIEKEFFDKVILKNEHVLAANVLGHYFSDDNTEVVFVQLFKNWNAMKLSDARTTALIETAWPDVTARRSFMDKRRSFFESHHSDEIYSVNQNVKELLTEPSKPLVYYVRISERNYPKDGTNTDFAAISGQYFDAVTKKNENIKAYYSYSHLYGAKSTDFVEVFVVENLAAIESMFDRDDALYKENWKDAEKQKEFDAGYNKYFTGKHADYLYMSVPGLRKSGNQKVAEAVKK